MAKWYSIQGQKKSQVHIIFVASQVEGFFLSFAIYIPEKMP